MNKLSAVFFSALIGLFIVGCGDPGEMDEGMEDMQQQQQQDTMGGQDDAMGAQDDGMGGMEDDTYGEGQEDSGQEW